MQTNALMPITQATVITLFCRPPYFEQSTPSTLLPFFFVLLSRIVVLMNWILIDPSDEPVLLFLLLLFVTSFNMFLNVQLSFFFLDVIHFWFFHRFLDLHLLCFLLIPCLHPASFLSDLMILQRSIGCIFRLVAFLLLASSIIEFNIQSSELQYLGLHTAC